MSLVVIIFARVSPTNATTKEASNRTRFSDDEWYLPTEDKDVPFLYVYEIGRGEPVVVLHGGPGIGHHYLTGITNGLNSQFRFVFYDQRGAGLSYAYSKAAISMEKNI